MEVLIHLTQFFRHETLQSLGIKNALVPYHATPDGQGNCPGSEEIVPVFSLTGYDLTKKTADILVKCRNENCKKPLATKVSISI